MIEYINGVAHKWCPHCENYLLVEMFGKHRGKPDNLTGYCKSCLRKYRSKYQPEWRANNPNYQHEWLEKNRERYNQQKREYYQNNPDKYYKAIFADQLNKAIRAGKITKPNNCSICGSTKDVQGHHPDYEPGHELIVVWVCRRCHANIHKELKNGTV